MAEGLRAAGAELGLVESDFEVWRSCASKPASRGSAAELDESVLPAEAGLDRAVSTRKGCYTGQEVVERLRSRAR